MHLLHALNVKEYDRRGGGPEAYVTVREREHDISLIDLIRCLSELPNCRGLGKERGKVT